MFYQQGDVLIFPIQDLEKRKKTKKVISNDIILAEGEVTGHAHRIKKNEYVEVYEDVETKCLLLRLLEPQVLKHEEHKEIICPIGDYEIRKVIEYDHFLEEAREVKD